MKHVLTVIPRHETTTIQTEDAEKVIKALTTSFGTYKGEVVLARYSTIVDFNKGILGHMGNASGDPAYKQLAALIDRFGAITVKLDVRD